MALVVALVVVVQVVASVKLSWRAATRVTQTETGFGCQTPDGQTCKRPHSLHAQLPQEAQICTTGNTGFACQTSNNSNGSPCTGPAFSTNSPALPTLPILPILPILPALPAVHVMEI